MSEPVLEEFRLSFHGVLLLFLISDHSKHRPTKSNEQKKRAIRHLGGAVSWGEERLIETAQACEGLSAADTLMRLVGLKEFFK